MPPARVKGRDVALPLEMNFRMPAEWEPHEATWLGWPHELTDWPGKFSTIPWAFAEIVRHLARVERVFLIVEDRASEARAKAVLAKSGAALEAITFFHIPTDRGWMRDSGPIGVVSADQQEGMSSRARAGLRPDEGSAVALLDEQQKQIPRTPSRAPEDQGKSQTARDSARDDSSHVGG